MPGFKDNLPYWGILACVSVAACALTSEGGSVFHAAPHPARAVANAKPATPASPALLPVYRVCFHSIR